jgi:16S rRNA (guanine(1405)-N(7))-methyltransferase
MVIIKEELLEALLDEIKKSRKYANISDETILRICKTVAPKYKKQKDIIKAVKNQLHIMHGAFFPENCHKAAMKIISGYECSNRELSRALLELHPSTKERLPVIGQFYDFLAPYTKTAKKIMDIGCGFNPCAFPWMKIDNIVEYYASDIDYATIEVIKAYFKREKINSKVEIFDVISTIPEYEADITFLFKLVPVLEQQQKGLAYHLIKNIHSKFIIITFPIKSLSGKEKGMEQFYSSRFESNLPKTIAIQKKEIIGTELVYVITDLLEGSDWPVGES